jgi:hypothetical protein
VSGWAEASLVVIAIATLATAVVQIGVLVAAGRLARRVERLVDHAERELKPLFGHLNAIGQEASRAAGLAATQVERVDTLFADLARRVDEAVGALHASVAGPVRESAALLRGFQAAFNSLRRGRSGRSRQGAEGEDALFI